MGKKLTIGHLLRHSPSNSSAGLEAAVIDVAQDYLLAHLQECGVLDNLAIKGGTGLRKFYAGKAGRFSTDLDFTLIDPNAKIESVQDILFDSINNYKNDYFGYSVIERRGKLEIQYESDFIDSFALTTKIDIGPSLWLKPETRSWIPTSIHSLYGFNLPKLNVISIPENLSEKLARVNRRLLARDLYDLVWVASTTPYSGFDREIVKTMTILKIWVDNYGLSSVSQNWGRVIDSTAYKFNSFANFNTKEISDEQIGLLTTPPPNMRDLLSDFTKYFNFLSDLNSDQQQIILGKTQSKGEVISKIKELDKSILSNELLW
jgi:predicted nucleotidyltransferase component of viral defense system